MMIENTETKITIFFLKQLSGNTVVVRKQDINDSSTQHLVINEMERGEAFPSLEKDKKGRLSTTFVDTLSFYTVALDELTVLLKQNSCLCSAIFQVCITLHWNSIHCCASCNAPLILRQQLDT